MDDELDEIVDEFVIESHENLDQLDRALVALEQNPDQDVIARIFRTIHTLKGTSGFLGFSTLESLTHVGENLLSKLRDGELAVTAAITTELLAMVDAVREILGSIAETRTEGSTTYDVLVERLGRLDDGEPVDGPAPATPVTAATPSTTPRPETATTPVTPAPPAPPAPQAEPLDARCAAAAGTPPANRAAAKPAGSAPAAAEIEVIELDASTTTFPGEYGLFGEQLLREGKVTEADLARALRAQASGDPRRIGELLVEAKVLSPSDVADVLKSQAEERSSATGTVRVEVRLLDHLMNLVGELALVRDDVVELGLDRDDAVLMAAAQRLDAITTELQVGVVNTRMQQIENLWNKFPRVLRDLTVTCGKQARLEMEGKHTEVDKTLLEAIKDPLTHLIRNAVDHGLELPAVRTARGKSPEGTVRLSAFHEHDQVIIEIADDGAGIDADVIRRAAVHKGLLTSHEARARADHDIIGVIFEPGFSTAEQVSNISGRGVGMDVVKTNIEAIGGTVEVHTVVGRGTTFRVKIPLTAAITPSLPAAATAATAATVRELVHP